MIKRLIKVIAIALVIIICPYYSGLFLELKYNPKQPPDCGIAEWTIGVIFIFFSSVLLFIVMKIFEKLWYYIIEGEDLI